MSTSHLPRPTRATPSLLLSLLLHAALAAGVLVSVTPPARDARAESVEWSIELEPPELPPREEQPPPGETPPPGEQPLAPSPVKRATAPRPSTPRESSPVPPVNLRAAPPTTPAATASAPDPAPSAVPHARTAAPAAAPTAPRTPSAPIHGTAYAVSDVNERPRLLGHPRLRYPPRALRLGIDADVVLTLVVEASGNVSTARILRPAGNGFDEAALDAAQRLRFTPGRLQGTPVAVRVTWTCRFRAEG